MNARLEVISPIDGSVWCERPYATESEIDGALERARRAAPDWWRASLPRRQAVVSAFADRLEAAAEVLGAELAPQIGRPVRYGPSELRTTAERARAMVRFATDALAPVPGDDRPGFRLYIERVPLGVVLVLPAWNYPWLTAVNAVVPALLAGNAVVLKPSPQAPAVGERYAELLEAAGLPPGVCEVVHCDHDAVARMVADPRVAYVAFTGSVSGGRAVVKAASGRFLDLGLELGGKDPAYVRADANLDHAVEQIADGCFFNSGQSCCAVERVYVHHSLFDRFVEGAIEAAKKLVLGDPRDLATTLGPLARPGHDRFVRGQVSAALLGGAKLLVDDRDFPGTSLGPNYMAPQVLTGVNHRMAIMREETFGPVLSIMPVVDDEAAIRWMNDSRYGLTASIWSSDEAAALAIGDRLETGTVFLNRCDYLDPSLAWTGVKDSGRGLTLSRLGFERFTRPKSFHLQTGPRG